MDGEPVPQDTKADELYDREIAWQLWKQLEQQVAFLDEHERSGMTFYCKTLTGKTITLNVETLSVNH